MSGLTKCGGCGSGVTAEHKYQLICSECKYKFAYTHKTECPRCKTAIEKMENPLYLHYIYYHCTKNNDPDCPAGSVSELFIDGHLANYYKEHLQISESLSKWCIENLGQLGTNDHQNKQEKRTSLEKTLAQKEKEHKELALMKARGLLEDQEFLGLKETIGNEIKVLQKEVKELGHVDPQRIVKAERAFNLAAGVEELFKNGTTEAKKEAVSELVSNLTLKEKKLNVTNADLYSVIIDGLLRAKERNSSFEPRLCEATQGRNDVFEDVCPALLAWWDSFRTYNWPKAVGDIETTMKEINQLMALV